VKQVLVVDGVVAAVVAVVAVAAPTAAVAGIVDGQQLDGA
jgi:hypothetical protein